MSRQNKTDICGLKESLSDFCETLKERSIYCFTSDVDWASEYAMEQSVAFFSDFGIKPTFFLTHKSEVAESSLKKGSIEVGIHPNFLAGSSQGGSFEEIIDFCFKLLPAAECYRSHRYFDVNDVMESLARRGIKYTSNVCTLLENMHPFVNRSSMVSFPIFMEDGAYLLNEFPMRFGDSKKLFEGPGLKVINIHPMHLMINTPHFRYTREIKDRLTRDEWLNLDKQSISKLHHEGEGITELIKSVCGYAHSSGAEIKTLKELFTEIAG